MKKNILWILASIMTCSIGFVSCDKDDNPSNENETENTGKPGTSGRSYDLNPKVVEVREVTGLESVLEGALAITFKQIVVEYTSVGPDLKTPVRLTGSINMTPAVYAKKNKARCLNIYNQYTTAKHRERITQDLLDDVAFFVNGYQLLWKPLISMTPPFRFSQRRAITSRAFLSSTRAIPPAVTPPWPFSVLWIRNVLTSTSH